MSYYQRQAATFIDGTPIFKTPEEEQAENDIAALLEKSWSCECKSFGKLAPIDWFFVRHGRLIGVGELKTHPYEIEKYKTVFLNVRKWLAMSLASSGLGVPALFVVKFADGVLWADIKNLNTTNVQIGGCKRIVKSRNDIEPIILIDRHEMKRLPSQ